MKKQHINGLERERERIQNIFLGRIRIFMIENRKQIVMIELESDREPKFNIHDSIQINF